MYQLMILKVSSINYIKRIKMKPLKKNWIRLE